MPEKGGKMPENPGNSPENVQNSPKNVENSIHSDILEKLLRSYPILGTCAPAVDFKSITVLYYDFVGNRLIVTVEVGKCIYYEEKPVIKKEMYWDEEAGMHKHRVKGEIT